MSWRSSGERKVAVGRAIRESAHGKRPNRRGVVRTRSDRLELDEQAQLPTRPNGADAGDANDEDRSDASTTLREQATQAIQASTKVIQELEPGRKMTSLARQAAFEFSDRLSASKPCLGIATSLAERLYQKLSR